MINPSMMMGTCSSIKPVMPQNWGQHIRGDSYNARKLFNPRTKIFQNFCDSEFMQNTAGAEE